jgi:hypothetical protein
MWTKTKTVVGLGACKVLMTKPVPLGVTTQSSTWTSIICFSCSRQVFCTSDTFDDYLVVEITGCFHNKSMSEPKTQVKWPRWIARQRRSYPYGDIGRYVPDQWAYGAIFGLEFIGPGALVQFADDVSEQFFSTLSWGPIGLLEHTNTLP